eukprot:PhF_6_TR14903/c0_g1_i2/m.23264
MEGLFKIFLKHGEYTAFCGYGTVVSKNVFVALRLHGPIISDVSSAIAVVCSAIRGGLHRTIPSIVCDIHAECPTLRLLDSLEFVTQLIRSMKSSSPHSNTHGCRPHLSSNSWETYLTLYSMSNMEKVEMDEVVSPSAHLLDCVVDTCLRQSSMWRTSFVVLQHHRDNNFRFTPWTYHNVFQWFAVGGMCNQQDFEGAWMMATELLVRQIRHKTEFLPNTLRFAIVAVLQRGSAIVSSQGTFLQTLRSQGFLSTLQDEIGLFCFCERKLPKDVMTPELLEVLSTLLRNRLVSNPEDSEVITAGKRCVDCYLRVGRITQLRAMLEELSCDDDIQKPKVSRIVHHVMMQLQGHPKWKTNTQAMKLLEWSKRKYVLLGILSPLK